jgi:hypothetical protein
MEAGGVVLVVHQLTQEANKHQSMEALVVEEALQVYLSFKSVISCLWQKREVYVYIVVIQPARFGT